MPRATRKTRAFGACPSVTGHFCRPVPDPNRPIRNMASWVHADGSTVRLHQVLNFVADLRAKRQIDIAAATGGANLLHPSKYSPSGAPMEETLMEDSQREQDLTKVSVHPAPPFYRGSRPRGHVLHADCCPYVAHKA